MKPIIEGYYVESTEGLFFAVKGLVHPPEAVVAYLRYATDPGGERQREGIHYRRLYSFEEQEMLLEEKYPFYLFFDPVFGERLQGVPRERIKRVYDPCLKLAELRRNGGRDELEEKAIEFANLLIERAEIPEENIGISGSILVGLHTPRSDIDLTVYGSESCWAVHKALREMLDEPEGEVRKLNERESRTLYALRSQDTPMSFGDFVRLEGRKVIQGKFRGYEYFIRFVRMPSEAGEEYGKRKYTSLGEAEVEATVSDASGAIFTPCSYRIEHTQLVGAQQAEPLLKEVVSFRGRFCEQARKGERIIARGKLEEVVTEKGTVHHRLLLGGRGDSIVVV